MSTDSADKDQVLPRLCLNMIVKNEAAIIHRCLESVAAHISCWSILDTGSTDSTPTIIQDFFAARHIPGQVHHAEFIDFSTSRNQALDLCRASEEPFEYILLIDADMELVATEPGWTKALTANAYSLRQLAALVYDNLRLLKRTANAEYIGITHEYLDVSGNTEHLADITMLDHACGSNRTDKCERDIRLLHQGLELDPDNLRYMFYLAQSLRDSNKFEEAIVWYQKRRDGGGWDEECWYSAYQKSNCLFQIGDYQTGICTALEAFNQRPWRSEPIALLCRHYGAQNQYHLCSEFATMGLNIPFPQQDKLFIEAELYEWFFRQELSIAAYYVSDKTKSSLGAQFCEQLAIDPLVPDIVRQTARTNLRFYAHPADTWLGLQLQEVYTDWDSQQWNSTNPSICLDGSKRAILVRQVNYAIEDQHYKTVDNVIRSKNLLVTINTEYQVTNHTTLENCLDARSSSSRASLAERHDFPVKGYEDGRLLRWRDRWWLSATVRDTTKTGICEIALLKLTDQGLIEREYLLRGNWSDKHQKNWMPFIYQDAIHFVYSLSPTVILRFDEDSGKTSIIHESQPYQALEHLRGGAQLVHLEGEGWLGICHEALSGTEGERHYLHRFFMLDMDWQVHGLTEAFKLSPQNIEFCSGLAREGTGDTLALSYGVNDALASVATINLQNVRQHLQAIR